MDPLLAAQADDPFDPTPMLIQADWLEEAGDPVGAAVLRGLIEYGTLSLHALALEAMLCSAPWKLDLAKGGNDGQGYGDGYGIWFTRATDIIYGCGESDGYGYGNAHGDGLGHGNAHGCGDRDGDWYGGGGA